MASRADQHGRAGPVPVDDHKASNPYGAPAPKPLGSGCSKREHGRTWRERKAIAGALHFDGGRRPGSGRDPLGARHVGA